MARLILFADEFGNRVLRRERVFRDRRNPLECYNDYELYERFRFPREDIYELTDLLRDDIECPTKRNHAIPLVMCVLTALRFYATGNYHMVTADLFGIHRTSASRVILKVSSALAKRFEEFVHFPPEGEQMRHI